MMIHEMPGIGKVNEEKLMQSGISSAEELINIGSKEAFLKVRSSVDPGACLHMLYGLEAGIRGIPKKLLPVEVKNDLKNFYNKIVNEDIS